MSSAPSSGARVPTDSSAVAERYRAAIYRYVSRLVANSSLADDLTQETFVRVHQHLDELKEHAALEAWLYRVATNVCYDHFRRRDQRQPGLPLPGQDDGWDPPVAEADALRPDQLLERSEMSDCVLRFLIELPEARRRVLILHDLQGYTNPEIARLLGLSLENVKIRLHRARARLRAELSGGCDFSRDERGVFVCEPKRS
jgi:RNA polymerase sigma-70 factor (ECF subfamily)